MSCVYSQKNLISSIALTASVTDPNDVNPIGLVVNNQTLWVAQNGKSLVSQYELNGTLLAFVNSSALPSGLVFNPLSLNNLSTNFLVTSGTNTGSANLILVTQNGVIQGFNSTVDPLNFITVFTGSGKVFYGVALAQQTSATSITPTIQQLYVTNFASGFVEVYNSTWTQIAQFTDTSLTALGYGPLGIAVTCQNLVYVTYALRGSNNVPTPGIGLGFVDIFSAAGSLLTRFASAGSLNVPYGLDIHSDYVLIGNNGDGNILRYDISSCDRTGEFTNFVTTCHCGVIRNANLWSITTNVNTGSTVFFNAGINNQASGITGKLCKHHSNHRLRAEETKEPVEDQKLRRLTFQLDPILFSSAASPQQKNPSEARRKPIIRKREKKMALSRRGRTSTSSWMTKGFCSSI